MQILSAVCGLLSYAFLLLHAVCCSDGQVLGHPGLQHHLLRGEQTILVWLISVVPYDLSKFTMRSMFYS
jgi:hypothetical protein